MEYRRRHLMPRPDLHEVLHGSLTNEEFLKKTDVFGNLRKQLQIKQQTHGIQPVKQCTVTSECFAMFVNETIKKLYQNQRGHGKKGQMKPELTSEKVKQRLVKELHQPGKRDVSYLKLNNWEL